MALWEEKEMQIIITIQWRKYGSVYVERVARLPHRNKEWFLNENNF